MEWTDLRTDYTNAQWSGLKKYQQVDNSDGTVSFQDVTQYTDKDNSFFGANEANKMNAGMNLLAKNIDSTSKDAEAAAASAKAAATSESNAATSEKNAATSESNAKSSETAAATSETNAKSSETAAATSATNAKTSETNAATSESNAKLSETAAAKSATDAATSESNAKSSQTAAATSESNAKASETNAATSASTASIKATAAATSATSAATSESNAAASASTASTKATEASTSATNAASSATAAAASAKEAATFDPDLYVLKTQLTDPTSLDKGGYIGRRVEGGGIIFFDYAIGFKGDVSVVPITSGLNTYHVDTATGMVVKDTTSGTNRFYIVQDRDLIMTKDGDHLMWSNGASGTLYTSLGTATGFGTGLSNTEKAIAAAETDGLLEWNTAAYKCIWHYIWKGDYQYRSPKWFVPSKDELNVLLNMQWQTASKRKSYDGTVQLKQLSTNFPPYLWSSSEQSATIACDAYFYGGYMNTGNKNDSSIIRVRLVRTF